MRSVLVLFVLQGCFSDVMTEDVGGTTGSDVSSSTTSATPTSSSASSSTSSTTAPGSTSNDDDSSTSEPLTGTSVGEESGSGSSGSSSSESTGDPLAHDGIYEFCYEGNEFNCDGSLVTECVYGISVPGGAGGFCSKPCETDADCPKTDETSAQPTCIDSCGIKTCWLMCYEYECPENHSCVMFTEHDCTTQISYLCMPDQT